MSSGRKRRCAFAFLYSRENKNQSTVFRLESVASAVSRRKSAKGDKGSRKNNYLNGLIILTMYDTIDENKSEVSKMRRFDYSFLKDKAWDNEIVGYLSQIHELKGKQTLYLRQKPADVEKLIEIANTRIADDEEE